MRGVVRNTERWKGRRTPAQYPSTNHPRPRRRYGCDLSLLTRVRHVMIQKMARPEEVQVVENDEGEVVKQVRLKQNRVLVSAAPALNRIGSRMLALSRRWQDLRAAGGT